ncbi:MAG: efflux RND transporter periplasmic adaptor subunit [Spirochaetota bacterium]|nr:efflux RND transporter periplasmic adaptor subunit [Spirochaetota bacterium]
MKRDKLIIILILGVSILYSACTTKEKSDDKMDKSKSELLNIESSSEYKDPKTKFKGKTFKLSSKSSSLLGMRTEKVIVEEEKFSLHFTGKLAYNQDTLSLITTKQNGIVRDIYKTIGDLVGTGENLLRVESTQLGKAQQDYLNSLALLREAEKNFNRVNVLYQKRIISENEYLKEMSNYRVHKNHVLSAENELRLLGFTDLYQLSFRTINSFIELRSPLNGTIIERYANLGEMISPNKPAYKIADLSTLWLFMDIYEKDFRFINLGQKVLFTPVSYQDKEFYGTIDYLNSEVTGNSRTIKVRAIVKNNDRKRLLLPNMYVKGRIEVSTGKKVTLIPVSALIDAGNRQYVFVEKKKNKLEPREVNVDTGRIINNYYIVKEKKGIKNVKEGDSVIVNANFLLDSESQYRKYIQETEIKNADK